MKTSKIKSISVKAVSLFLVMLFAVSCVALTGCGDDNSSSNAQGSTSETVKETAKAPTGSTMAIIDVKNYGQISVALYADEAPITVANFIKLAKSGFYDGLTFHRIIKQFMIQGGDPNADGTGGSDETIKGEFTNNGVENHLSHTRGAISMARSSDMDSASSQFFIVQQNSTYLDGDYAVFGYVTSGIEIVDKICEDVTVQDSNGTVLKDDQPVISSITIE